MKLHSPLPERKTKLEIIPLIDVMFFLLASFMMVSLTMSKQQTIKLNLPEAGSAKKDFKPDNVNLGVNAQGEVFWQDQKKKLNEIELLLIEKYKENKDVAVFISGDAEVRHADMIKILDVVRGAGFNKVAFQVSEKK
jgi:biopolymer transport protein ExbD